MSFYCQLKEVKVGLSCCGVGLKGCLLGDKTYYI